MTKEAIADLGVTVFDAASELTSWPQIVEFLQACMDEAPEDAAFIAHALGVVARAQTRMASIAEHAGLSRESLYKALSGRRDPSFSTILKVVAGLGLRLQFVPETKEELTAPAVKAIHSQTANSAVSAIEFKNWSRASGSVAQPHAMLEFTEWRDVADVAEGIKYSNAEMLWAVVTAVAKDVEVLGETGVQSSTGQVITDYYRPYGESMVQ